MAAPTVSVAAPSAASGTLGRSQVYAIAAAHCAGAFAALGLPPYLPRLLPELGDPQARWAGVLYVLPTLCTALATPIWGRMADRFGPKKLLVRAQLGLAVAFALAAMADNITTLVIALITQGLLGGTYGASTAYLATGLQGDALARGLSALRASARMALAGAPALAGLLSSTLDVRQMYGLAAMLPLASAIITIVLCKNTVPGASGEDSRGNPEQAPPRSRLTVAGLCLAEGGFVLVTVVTFPYFLPLSTQVAPWLPTVVAGILFAAPHVLYLLVSAPALRWLRGRARAGMALGFALAAISAAVHFVPVLTGWDGLSWLVLGRVLLGAALTCGLTALSLLGAEAATGRRPGRLFGTVEAASKVGAVLAGASASALAGFGPAAPLTVAVLAGTVLAGGTHRFTTSGPHALEDRSERSSS